MHQSQAQTGNQCPSNLACSPVTPSRRNGKKTEEDQQHLVDIVTTVKNEGRRHCGEKRRPDRSGLAQAVRDERKQQDEPDPKQHRENTQTNLGEVIEIWTGGQPSERPGRISERRPMELVWIVFIAPLFPKLAELDGIDRLIIVHRPLVQPRATKPEAQNDNQREKNGPRL